MGDRYRESEKVIECLYEFKKSDKDPTRREISEVTKINRLKLDCILSALVTLGYVTIIRKIVPPGTPYHKRTTRFRIILDK